MTTTPSENHVRSVGKIAESLLGDVSQRQRQGGVEISGIPTGFYKVDEYTDGLQPDQAWLVGAATGCGKTSFLMDIALATAERGVLIYSLEMSGEALVYRLLSQLTNISPIRIKRGKLTEEEFGQVRNAAATLSGYKVAVVDKTFTSADLMEHAKRQRERFEFGLLMVDYVQILRDANAHGAASRVAQISLNLRSLARPDQLNMPLILISQLNRESQKREDDTPQLSDFKESSQLEQDAEVAILLHRPHLKEMRVNQAEPQECETAQIIVAKNRNGPIGFTSAKFYPRTMRWEQKKPDPVKPESLAEKVKRGRS